MAKITITEPDGPYHAVLDTGVMVVQLREVFLGVRFISESGEMLSVAMRDNGFEVHYTGDFGEKGFDAGWFDFKDSHVTNRHKIKEQTNAEKTRSVDLSEGTS